MVRGSEKTAVLGVCLSDVGMKGKSIKKLEQKVDAHLGLKHVELTRS